MEDAAVAVDPDRPCPHLHFDVEVDVGRIGEDDPGANGRPRAYVAEISVSCAAPPNGCGEAFRFTGVPAGLSFNHPTVTVDEATLNAPIRPASADPDFGTGLPGFAIRMHTPPAP